MNVCCEILSCYSFENLSDKSLSFADGPEIDSFKTSPQDGEIIESKTTTFTCSVDTQPGADIQLIGPKEDTLESVSNTKELTFNLLDVGCADSGTYTCKTQNQNTGKNEQQQIEINVKCWFEHI
jgi:hypothetical protein